MKFSFHTIRRGLITTTAMVASLFIRIPKRTLSAGCVIAILCAFTLDIGIDGSASFLQSGMSFGHRAFAEENNDYNKEYLEMNSVQEMYVTYHGRVNQIFNNAIKKTFSGEGVVQVSEDEAEQNEMCENPNNIATVCLGIKALYEYRGYEEAMRAAVQSALPLFEDEEASLNPLGVALKAGTKTTFIYNELGRDGNDGRALDALDQAIAFYDEFKGAYAMHIDNDRLIRALETYNTKISEIRTETYDLAPQFHNVTTDGGQCT